MNLDDIPVRMCHSLALDGLLRDESLVASIGFTIDHGGLPKYISVTNLNFNLAQIFDPLNIFR